MDVYEKEHGYVILAGLSLWVTLMWMGANVGKARKKYGIRYPKMYADGAEAETENGNMFNCIQRAHQNTLESIPTFLFALAVVGAKYPVFASVCCMLHVVGRILYAKGYYTGDPANRARGNIPSAIGFLSLLGCTAFIAIRLVVS